MPTRVLVIPVSALALIMSATAAHATYSQALPAQANFSQVKSSAKSVTGSHGEILTVSQTRDVRAGQTLLVTGNRFDETVGIYVAVCVTPKKGVLPSPCGGGADESGSLGASQWISSNPPPYGESLAVPFKAGGRFAVKIKVSPKIGNKDCRKISCAVVVRADHTRGDDRSHDVVVPLTFKK